MSQEKPQIAFIGLGAMGFGMATNLVKEGYPVTGFDVYGPTLERFTKAGGKAATTPSEAVTGKDYCVCMVATSQQAQAVLLDGENPAVNSLPQGAVIFLCSTVACGYVQGLEKEIAERGRPDVFLIDCPVSGGAIRAADGTLSIMAGASDAALEKGRAILDVMADPAKLYIAKGVGAGSNLKMVHQVLAANQILSSSEALGFAKNLGLDINAVAGEIVQSDGWSWMLENRLPRILAEDHQPVASALNIIVKDAGIITSEGRRYAYPTPMCSAAEQSYISGIRRYAGGDDDGSLIRLYTEGVEKVGPVKAQAETKEDKISLVISLLKGIHLCSAIESLAFSKHVDLDLDQVFNLCENAAGGSKMFSAAGPEIIRVLRGDSAPQESSSLALWQETASGLSKAVEEGQRLKVPLNLGPTALSLIRIASKSSGGLSSKDLIALWA